MQNVRVAECAANLLFAFEPREGSRIAFEARKRHFQRDQAPCFQIGRLEHRAHRAAMNDVGDLKTLVQKIAGLQLLCRGGHGGRRRVIRHAASVMGHSRHILDSDDLHRDVVLGSSLLCEPHEMRACIAGRHAVDRVAHFIFRDASVKTVAALNHGVTAVQNGPPVIHLDRRVDPNAAGEHRAEFARHRLFLRDEAHLALHLHVGVIRGQLPDLPSMHEVGPGIADVSHGDLVAPEQRHSEGRGHLLRRSTLDPCVVDSQVCCTEQPPQQLIVGCFGIGLAKGLERSGDGEAAGNVAVAVPADAVGEQGNRAATLLLDFVVGFPEEKEILVRGTNRTDEREFGVRKLHSRVTLARGYASLGKRGARLLLSRRVRLRCSADGPGRKPPGVRRPPVYSALRPYRAGQST